MKSTKDENQRRRRRRINLPFREDFSPVVEIKRVLYPKRTEQCSQTYESNDDVYPSNSSSKLSMTDSVTTLIPLHLRP